MTQKQLEQGRASVQRAKERFASANDGLVIAAFSARGIPEGEILPRENVFTYRGWQALGRQVRKGEKSVKLTTWIPVKKTDAKTGKDKEGCVPRSAAVFHISQTDPIDA